MSVNSGRLDALEIADMDGGTVKFSLILATVGRSEELRRFLQHLDQQTYRNFELIVVDQNPEGFLELLIREYEQRFPILHLRSGRGLSRARNVGLQHFSGDVVAFPDDDCWYAPDTLEKLAHVFHENSNYDGFTGRGVDGSRPADYVFFSHQEAWVDKKNVWHQGTSFSIFLRTAVIQAVGPFDESLGVGSESGRHSAEEVDYLIRAVGSGFKIYYCPDLYVYHAYPIPRYSRDLIKRGHRYSVGFGHVLRKHKYPFSSVFYYLLRPFGGAAVSLLTLNFAKSRYHLAILKGRVLGWLG